MSSDDLGNRRRADVASARDDGTHDDDLEGLVEEASRASEERLGRERSPIERVSHLEAALAEARQEAAELQGRLQGHE